MQPDHDRFRFSGEFASTTLESAYRDAAWSRTSRMTRTTLLVIAFMGMAFFVSDLLAVKPSGHRVILFLIRLLSTAAIAAAAVQIGRSPAYARRWDHLLFLVQLIIPLAIYAIAVLRQMPAVYVGVDAILFTLVYYQFLSNRFGLTVAASAFFGLSTILFSFLFLEFKPLEMFGAFLFLIPLNFLGITILRSLNRTRRREFAALEESKRHIAEKEQLIQELQAALAEVKTLQGFLPICSKCKKIRDDQGFWERIEKYIQDRTDARFSHSLCPTCAAELYGVSHLKRS